MHSSAKALGQECVWRAGAEWVLGEQQEGKLVERAGLGHAGLRPGQIGGAPLGLWEVTEAVWLQKTEPTHKLTHGSLLTE